MMRRFIFPVVLVAILTVASAALAQIPPHRPGEICMTPQGWCWASPPGPPGSACSCGSAQGSRG